MASGRQHSGPAQPRCQAGPFRHGGDGSVLPDGLAYLLNPISAIFDLPRPPRRGIDTAAPVAVGAPPRGQG